MSLVVVAGNWHLIGGGQAAGAGADVEASGPASLPLANFRTLLSNVSAFQEFVSKGNASQAAALIYWEDVEKPDAGWDSAFAMISEEEFDRGGFEQANLSTGVIACLLQRNVPSDYQDSPEEAMADFRNKIGAIIDGIILLQGTDRVGESTTYMVIQESIGYVGPPGRVPTEDRNTLGDYCQATLSIPWGP